MTTTSDNIAAISKVLEGAELAKRECVFAAQEARKANGSDTYSSRVLDKASTVIDGLVSALLAEASKAEEMKLEIAEKDARIAALEAALMPFASHKTADGLPNGLLRIPDGHPVLFNGLGNDVRVVATIGDIRRARTLLNGGSDAQG